MALATHYKKRFEAGEWVYFQPPGQPKSGPHQVVQVVSDTFAPRIGAAFFAQQNYYPAKLTYAPGYYYVFRDARLPIAAAPGIYDYLIPQHIIKKVCEPANFPTMEALYQSFNRSQTNGQ